MTEQLGTGAKDSITIERLQEVLIAYLEKMDAAKIGEGTLFRTLSGQADLETKVWHCFYKVEASAYHMQAIKKGVEKVRAELKKNTQVSLAHLPLAVAEFKMTINNRTILYDIDAFFAASRSAIDFLGSCLSRYIKKQDTDRFRVIVKYLSDVEDDLANQIIQEWEDWVTDLVDYRDYLVHQGVLPTATASHIVIDQPQGSEEVSQFFAGLSEKLGGQSPEPIVFPLPRKPNKALRITRQDVLETERSSDLPTGLTQTTINVGKGQPSKSGPTIRASISRGRGSDSTEMSIGGPLRLYDKNNPGDQSLGVP